MRDFIKIISFVLSFFLFQISLYSQDGSPSTEGKEFWVTFMKNGNYGCRPNGGGHAPSYEFLKLTIASRYNCSGTVSNPNTGYSQNFTVTAWQRLELTIPYNEAYTDIYGNIVNTGLLITTTEDVCIFASNSAINSFEPTLLLPTRCLGKEYSVTTNGTRYYLNSCGEVFAAQFAILATTNNTRVRITPKLATNNGKPKDIPFEITLNRGQVYMVGAEHPAGSYNQEYKFGLTGSWVEVVQGGQIALFQGNSLAAETVENVYSQYLNRASHIYDQAIPVKYYGKQLAAVMMGLTGGDGVFITITGLYDDTHITYLDDTPLVTLNKGDSYGMYYSNSSIGFNSDKPCTFYYTTSVKSEYPSMTMVACREQACDDFIFATVTPPGYYMPYTDMITLTVHSNSVNVNGSSVYFSPSDIPGYSYCPYSIPVENQVYNITSQSGVIAAFVPVGEYSFLCSIGGSMLTQFMYIDDILSNEIASNQKYCVDVPIDFRSE
ncbi:MAG: IgGFc-binding protein, partial [Bacteroidales bacterium]|nr:IgGFc-binding protein [Bacteroidales bacterium]